MATTLKTTVTSATPVDALLQENDNQNDNTPTLNNNGIHTMLLQKFSQRFPDLTWSNIPMTEFISWLHQSFNNNNDSNIAVENGVGHDKNGIMQKQPNVEFLLSKELNTITNQPPKDNKSSTVIPPIQLPGMDIQSPCTSIEYIVQDLTVMGEEELTILAYTFYAPLYQFRASHI